MCVCVCVYAKKSPLRRVFFIAFSSRLSLLALSTHQSVQVRRMHTSLALGLATVCVCVCVCLWLSGSVPHRLGPHTLRAC